MRLFAAALVACSTMMCAGGAQADETPTIAVFTKNSTNPAYEAFRLGADQVARIAGAGTVHFVPRQPDNIEEQKAMVEQVLKNPPAAVVLIPVDDVAMVESVRQLNAAGIPVVLASNPLPGQFVTYVGADDFEIGYREARYLFERLGGRNRIVVIEGTAGAPTTANACAATSAPSPNIPISRCLAPSSAIISRPTPSARWKHS
jgi:ribose transport system substrate-binding protein